MELIKQNNFDYVSAKELHISLGIKRKYANWINESIERAGLEENKDFITFMLQSTGGRPSMDYLLNKDASITVIVMSGGKNAKQLRKEVIDVYKKRQSLELLTVKEYVFAMKVVNCLKFIDNQKEAYSLHKNSFIEENNNTINPKYIYAEFAKYRAKIVGWNKEKTDKAINEYLNNHSGYNRSKLLTKDMSTKISVIDIGEAIRIAVLDILYFKKEDETLANNFSLLCKNLAKEMQIEPDKTNSVNLFKSLEKTETVKSISLK